MVSYASTLFDPSKFDQESITIYNELSKLYNHPQSFYDMEDSFYDILKKYNDHYLVWYFLGNFYKENKRYENAIHCYKISISKKRFVDVFLNLAIVYHICNNLELMKNCLASANEVDPNDVRIINYLGVSYYLDKDYYKAYEYYKKIIDSNATKVIYNNIGFTCTAIGKSNESISYFDKGLKIPSTMEDKNIDVQLLQNKLLCYDYLYQIPENNFNDYLKINDLYGISTPLYPTEKTHDTKIKIGYVSPDFRKHVVSFFTEPILRQQNRSLFEIYCYSNSPYEDDMTRKLKSFNGIKWFDIYGMPDDKVAELIYSHRIDILVDLAGHTNDNRLGVFAMKPAHMQVTYLGFPNSTGLTTIDYRITDKFADPIDTKQKFTEKLIRMPKCFICFESSVPLINIPIKFKTSETIVFAVINKIQKHNDDTFEVWKTILSKIPNSIMLIKKDIKSKINIDLMYQQKFGEYAGQIKMLEHIENYTEHLLNHNNIDICLDTFPYSGTTTTCCTLLMSTPIITLHMPNRHVSNVSESILKNMGYGELVACSKEEYIQKAIELAQNYDRIIEYKKNIRKKFLELMNPNEFVKDFDQLLYQTYQNH